MSLELDEVLGEVLVQPAVGDVPQLHGAVLRGGGDDVVVEGVPLDVQDLPAVSRNLKAKRGGCLSNVLSRPQFESVLRVSSVLKCT